MMPGGTAEAIVSLAEAQAFARVETGEEEALLAGFIRTASGLCEAFLCQAVIERPFTEAVAASAQWQRLNAAPVRAVASVSKSGVPLPVSSYSVDVDSSGSGPSASKSPSQRMKYCPLTASPFHLTPASAAHILNVA